MLYYIAYIDILGSKAIFTDDVSSVDISEFLKSNRQLAKDVVSKTGVMFEDGSYALKSFSDNFVILIKCTGTSNDLEKIQALSRVIAQIQLKSLVEYKILLRGGITKGDAFVDDNIVCGRGLIHAVELEHEAVFPRIIFDEMSFEKDTLEMLQKTNEFISKDNDEKYYVDFLELLVESRSDRLNYHLETTSLSKLRENIIDLVRKHARYRNERKSDKIEEVGKKIVKYTWILLKFNDFCEKYNSNMRIHYSFDPHPRFMRCQIKVKK